MPRPFPFVHIFALKFIKNDTKLETRSVIDYGRIDVDGSTSTTHPIIIQKKSHFRVPFTSLFILSQTW